MSLLQSGRMGRMRNRPGIRNINLHIFGPHPSTSHVGMQRRTRVQVNPALKESRARSDDALTVSFP